MVRKNPNIDAFISWLPYLLIFACSFVYFGFFCNYIFFPQEKSSLFIFSSDFLNENLHQPGGLLIWLGKFFSTFYYFPVIGAIILSSVLTLSAILISKIILILEGQKSLFIPGLVIVTLFFLQTDFHFLLFCNLGLLLQLSIFCLVLKYLTFLKGWIPVIIVPIWFYFTGSFTFIYLLLITLYFAFDKKNKGWTRIFALWCISALTFYISKELVFPLSGKTLLTFPFPEHIEFLQEILFISAAAIISLLPLISKIRPGIFKSASEFSVNLYSSVILLIFMAIIGLNRFDIKTRRYLHVEELFYQDRFDEIITYNTLHPTSNMLTIYLTNIALCETDKLDDLLFHFQQSHDGRTLFLKWEMAGEVLNRGGYFYYTTGMINEAHRWAFENMVMKGMTPEGLKMLIKTDLIYGNFKTAASYINILKRSLFYRKEALKYEKLLINKDSLAANKELVQKQQTKVKSDFFTITENPYINIERILASDSLNRKAFEYKMAFMLLTKNYREIEHELPHFEDLGFTRLPVHIEEAALALSLSNNGKLPDTGKLHISMDTKVRWNQFLTVLRQYRNNVKSAEPELRKRFGDTFWYWVFYR